MSAINDLSKRTDTVVDAVAEAEATFRSISIRHNGWGVLTDPSMLRAKLATARDHLVLAIGAIDQAKWPGSDADWEKLEQEHNAERSDG